MKQGTGDQERYNDRVSRTLSLPRAQVALLARARRRLAAALDEDLTDASLFERFIDDALPNWVAQKLGSVSGARRPSPRRKARRRNS